MKAKKLFYKECHLAGRLYHEANEVWDQLKVGTLLHLVRDEENRFDPNAVAVVYRPVNDPEEEFLLGYIPSKETFGLCGILSMGWTDLFECRISKINPEAHYEQQISLCIRIKPCPDAKK